MTGRDEAAHAKKFSAQLRVTELQNRCSPLSILSQINELVKESRALATRLLPNSLFVLIGTKRNSLLQQPVWSDAAQIMREKVRVRLQKRSKPAL